VQQGTDLEHLKEIGRRFGHVFYVEPGPAPGMNLAYWGPPRRSVVPQSALSVNVGPETNVESINFTNNALAPTVVADVVQDAQYDAAVPVVTFFGTREPPLAAKPALPFNLPNVRTSLLEQVNGQTSTQAYARAQGVTDRSLDGVVTAQGELDALRYGGLLSPRGVVGLRGAGYTYDGLYYVKSVSHSIAKGSYKQRFTLTREGTGALTPVVRT
jgi:hypothetical protein